MRHPRPGLADFGDHERVALGVAEPEQRRRTFAEAADLGVDVRAAVFEQRVVGVGVIGRQRDAGPGSMGASTARW
jgi:hypothetical protein